MVVIGWRHRHGRLGRAGRRRGTAPASLRKGPRGGGRDRDKVIQHVIEADHAYAREIGLKLAEASFADRASVVAQRAAIAERLAGAHPAGPFEAGAGPALRRPAHRLARHRPRVGDRGPLSPG